MKKTLAIVVLMLILCSTLVACSTTVKTKQNIRWENETLTYAISLANFETSVTNSNGVFYKDVLGYGEQDPNNESKDQIVPQALTGSYVINIAVSGENCTVTTNQTMDATYNKEDVTLDTSNAGELLVTSTDSTVTLRSITKTSVTFVNTTQVPTSSTTEVNGYYIGKVQQNWSNYKVETQYSAIKKGMEATVTVNGESTTHKLEDSNIIDANQILTYLRSYDKTSTSFQSYDKVSIYDPYTNNLQQLTFSYVHAQNTLVEHTYADQTEKSFVPVAINNVNVLIGGIPYMTQLNLPDLTEERLDYKGTTVSIDAIIPKYTTLRFRVGYVTFDLTGYLTDAMVDAIKVQTTSAE